MTTPHEQRRGNVLRLIALTTNDPLARTVALDELGESEVQARHELLQTCWADDMSNLRTAAEANFNSKEKSGRRKDMEEIGAKVVLSDGRKGICVDAYPDFKSGKGLELVIAIGAATATQVELCDSADFVKANSYNVRSIHTDKA